MVATGTATTRSDFAVKPRPNRQALNGQHKVRCVGISRAYGGLNLGDEAILRVIVTLLRDPLPVEITVFSRDPQDTLARHPVDRASPVRELSQAEVLPAHAVIAKMAHAAGAAGECRAIDRAH